ncbi:MAG TPA: hypothetical protein VMS65_03225, partial [Polyangiaceae bacterium]|nr:hypothetical protein [Polyangiaceae bacterium]
RRFASTREFGDALAEALGRRSRGALPTLPDERHEVLRRAEPHAGARLLMGGAAAGALLGIAGIQLTSGLKERERAALAEPTRAPTRAVAWLSDAPTPSARPLSAASARRAAPNGSASAKVPALPAMLPSAAPLPSPDAGPTNDADAGE